MTEKDLFAEAVRQWGVDAQVSMAIEEMAELTKALCKMKRQDYRWGNVGQLRSNWESLAEEVADVELMLDQIKYMFEIHSTIEYKEQKLERLTQLLFHAERSPEYLRVREAIAWECLYRMVTVDHQRVDIEQLIYEYADQILALPEILIKKAEQELPDRDYDSPWQAIEYWAGDYLA